MGRREGMEWNGLRGIIESNGLIGEERRRERERRKDCDEKRKAKKFKEQKGRSRVLA